MKQAIMRITNPKVYLRNTLIGSLLVFFGLCGVGCNIDRGTYLQHHSLRLHVKSAKPEQYSIRISNNGNFQVPPDGRLTIQVEVKTHYLHMNYADAVMNHDSSDVRSITVLRGRRIVRRLPLGHVMFGIPEGSEYYVIELD